MDTEAAYLLEDSGPGARSRLARMHSRGGSTSSAASWESSALGGGGAPLGHSRAGSRAGGLDAQGAYVEASVSRMLAGRDRWGRRGGCLRACLSLRGSAH